MPKLRQTGSHGIPSLSPPTTSAVQNINKFNGFECSALAPTHLSPAGKRKITMNLLCENYAKTPPDWIPRNSESEPPTTSVVQNINTFYGSECNALAPTHLSSAGKRKIIMNLLCENYAKTRPDRIPRNSESGPPTTSVVQNINRFYGFECSALAPAHLSSTGKRKITRNLL